MHSLWNEPSRTQVASRLERLTSDTRASWGRMTAPQMVAHLSNALRMASGEIKPALRKLPLRYPGIKHLIIYVFPFPKNVATATELIDRVPGPWDRETKDLLREVQNFGKPHGRGEWPVHPAFGKLSPNAWGVLAYRHIDHHFKQFGI